MVKNGRSSSSERKKKEQPSRDLHCLIHFLNQSTQLFRCNVSLVFVKTIIFVMETLVLSYCSQHHKLTGSVNNFISFILFLSVFLFEFYKLHFPIPKNDKKYLSQFKSVIRLLLS